MRSMLLRRWALEEKHAPPTPPVLHGLHHHSGGALPTTAPHLLSTTENGCVSSAATFVECLPIASKLTLNKQKTPGTMHICQVPRGNRHNKGTRLPFAKFRVQDTRQTIFLSVSITGVTSLLNAENGHHVRASCMRLKRYKIC